MGRRNLFRHYVDNARTGPGLSLKRHDKGLFTVIGAQNKDSVGKSLSATDCTNIWQTAKMGQQVTEQKVRQMQA